MLTWEECTNSCRIESQNINLLAQFGDHFLCHIPWKCQACMTANDRERLQCRLFCAKQEFADFRICTICTNEQVPNSTGAVFEACYDCRSSTIVGDVGDGIELFAILMHALLVSGGSSSLPSRIRGAANLHIQPFCYERSEC